MGYNFDDEEEDVTGGLAPGMGDDDDTGDINQPGYSQQGMQGNQGGEPDVAPVQFSKKKVWVILMVFFIIILFVIGGLSRCSLGKSTKVKPDSSNTQNTGETGNNRDTVNSLGSDVNNQQILGENTEVDSTLSDESNSGNLTENNGGENQGGDNGQFVGVEVPIPSFEPTYTQKPSVGSETQGSISTPIPREELPDGAIVVGREDSSNELIEMSVVPAMGAEVKSSGIVKGIHMYKIGNSYVYGVEIVIVTSNDNSVSCQYFCPSKTYNQLSIGTALDVIYQMDSMGNVSIYSINLASN